MRNWTWKTWLILSVFLCAASMLVYNTWIKQPLSQLAAQERTFASVGSQVQQDACLFSRQQESVRSVFDTRDYAPWYKVRRAFEVLEAHPECFTHAEIAWARENTYEQLYETAYAEVERCPSWFTDSVSRSAKNAERVRTWRGLIADSTQISGRELENPFVPNMAQEEDRAHQLNALALTCGPEPTEFLTAMSEIKQIIDPDLQQTTALMVVKRFWNRYYRGHFEHSPDKEQLNEFRQAYPLADYWDPVDFAGQIVDGSQPLPMAYVTEQELTPVQWQDLVAFDLRTTRYVDMREIAQAYVNEGYNPSWIHGTVFEAAVRDKAYLFAIQYANEYLGAKQVKIAEDGRIAQLERTGEYSVAFINGKRTRIYPMNRR